MYTQRTRTSLDLSKQQLREIRNKYQHDSTENEQDDLDKATEQYETDEEKYNFMQEIARNSIKEIVELNAEIHKLKESVETADNKNNILENELQAVHSTNKALSDQIEEKDRQIEEIKKQDDNKLSEIKHNKDTITLLETQIEQLKVDLNNKAYEKENEAQRHKTETETFASTISEKDNTIGNLKLEMASLTLNLSDMQREIDKTKCDLQKGKLEIEALLTEVREKNAIARNLESEIESLTKTISDMKIEAQNQADVYAATIREKDEIIADLKLKLSGMQNEMENKIIAIQNHKFKIEALGMRGEEKDLLLGHLETKFKTLTKQYNDIQIEIQQLSDVKAKYEAHINETQQTIMTEQHEIEKSIDQLRHIEQNYKEAYEDAKCLTQEINILVDVKMRHDNTIAELKNSNLDLQRQLRNVDTKNKKKEREIRALRKKLASAEQENHNIRMDFQTRISNLQGNIDHLQETTVRLNYDISVLQAEKEICEADIIAFCNEIRLMKVLIKMFKKDIDAVAELKKDNDRLRRTDTTLFRIWCCAVILFVILCLSWQWFARIET